MQVHPSQISPSDAYDVFYFLKNHTDSTTYYVKAVVYDVRTGEVLDTQTLPQSATNSRLFIKTLTAPPDPVGLGRNIVAIATVYTDSSYTTKSENYEEQEQYFLIKTALPFAGGGGGVDYRTLREIVQEEVAKGLATLPPPKDFKVPDQPDMSFVDALFGNLGIIIRELGRVPKETANLSEILAELRQLRASIEDQPTPDAVDLSPVISKLEQISTVVGPLPERVSQAINTLTKGLQATIKEDFKTLGTDLEKNLAEVIESQEITIPVSRSTRQSRERSKEPEALPVPSHLFG